MASDTQVSLGAADQPESARLGAESKGDGCQCPYCGRTIPSEALQAQGYARADGPSDDAGDGPGPKELAEADESALGDDKDDAGIVSRFNASRPRPLQADAGRAAGLLSAARRMVKNKDY